MSEVHARFERDRDADSITISGVLPEGETMLWGTTFSKNVRRLTDKQKRKVIADCERAIDTMGIGNVPGSYRDLLYQLIHGNEDRTEKRDG